MTKKWKIITMAIVLIPLAFYGLFMAGYFYTSEPSFCAKCHEVFPYVESWKQSPHKEVKCLFCHEFRGFLGKLHSKARGLNYVYQQYTHQYSIFASALIFEQDCIACHMGDNSKYPNAPRLDKKHYDFLKANKSCLQCHRDTGHEVNIFTPKDFKK